MPLSCYCEYDDPPFFEWHPSNYSEMPARKRRARCSCGRLIEPGSTVACFERTRSARSYLEERIYGEGEDAIPLATRYLCERCADLYFSLSELGYECISCSESMVDLVKEYSEIQRERVNT